jgi:undecaprenyl phosphate-alpha-L-ara4FN deformylase
MPAPITVGLRVDVDTYRGTRLGVPALVDLFARHAVRATFFMTVGPDNMGRHLWRLLKPQFLVKMLRSNAANLYGWDILLRGTFWPGAVIGDQLADIMRLPQQAGHEMGLHAWDHHSWQVNIDRYSQPAMLQQLRDGFNKLSDILGVAPTCSAAAGWRCNEAALLLKEQFQFQYNSDCRGSRLFKPMVDGRLLTPQIPVTLPTYDEVIGNDGIDNENFNSYILDRCRADRLNVYTIHAEVEGIALHWQFEQLLLEAKRRGIVFQPLGALLQQIDTAALPSDRVIKHSMPGREGWLAWQNSAQPAAA